ncbi:MAG: winged helix-turn-helix transcriptional regulator [Syntrophomonadaceae bacterium]|nr:winged helix-turn-helix transcriptional regulator [Syntrophomonadaceae bacterium]
MGSIFPYLPRMKHILENFEDYDEERQQFIERQLEDIMSHPVTGRLVREYLGKEVSAWLPVAGHEILVRFCDWLEGSPVSRPTLVTATEDIDYSQEKSDQAAWCVQEPAHANSFPLLDLEQALILREGCRIPLTPVENAIMSLLYSARGRVVTHRHFEEWALDGGNGCACYEPKHHIRHLRDKLGDDPRKPELISNRRGIGYSLSPLVRAINT